MPLAEGKMKPSLKIREMLLLGCLGVLFLIMLGSFGIKNRPSRLEPYVWTPGYWQISPGIGMTRLIPYAGPLLASPAAGASAGEVRAKALP